VPTIFGGHMGSSRTRVIVRVFHYKHQQIYLVPYKFQDSSREDTPLVIFEEL
jgi:hypothetical protein